MTTLTRRLLALASIVPAFAGATALAWAIGHSDGGLVSLVDGVWWRALFNALMSAILFPWFLVMSVRYFADPIGDGQCLCCLADRCDAPVSAVLAAPAAFTATLLVAMLITRRPVTLLAKLWWAALVGGLVAGVLYQITDLRLGAFREAGCAHIQCGG